jgi:anthranilate synthase/aminodeoxychorismate synthase-like glutamine amidotransferase
MGRQNDELLEGGQRYLPDQADPSKRVLVIDNYDSFTFNLVQYLLELGAVVDVYRNDAITADQVFANGPSHLLMSPGPGTPAESGVCQELAKRVVDAERIPTLGVCLGHQTLCEMHGATVKRAERIMHGKRSPMLHDGTGVFAGLPSPYDATRYHSLIVEESTLPEFFVPVARTPEGELMAIRHVDRPIFGVQFHPESILTQHGHDLLRNWLEVGEGESG